MNNNTEPERDSAVETDYSAEEAEQMGAFFEDALPFEDVRESIEDFEQRHESVRFQSRLTGSRGWSMS